MRVAVFCAAVLAALLSSAARAQSADWQSEWKATVAAAIKEGEVICGCPQHPGSRQFLMTEWQKDYPGIKLEYTPAVLPEWPARVEAERSGGKYLWDVYFSGPGPEIYRLAHEKILAPILPSFILPDVKDPKTWGGWDDAFYDNAKATMFSFWDDLTEANYNAKLVPPDQMKKLGLKVLFDPAYKNKIIFWDPRYGGAGLNYATFIYLKDGEAGLKTVLVDQNATFLHDTNAMVERMVRGEAALSLGPDLAEGLAPYVKAGVPVDVRRFGDSSDIAMTGSGYGIASIFAHPADPNAAKLFINWLLSKPIQEGLGKAAKENSRRIDVAATPGAPPRPLPGQTYLPMQMEKYSADRGKVMVLARQLRPQ